MNEQIIYVEAIRDERIVRTREYRGKVIGIGYDQAPFIFTTIISDNPHERAIACPTNGRLEIYAG